MRNISQFFLKAILILGYSVLIFSIILRNSLSDFSRGFCQGFSIMFLSIWSMYLCYCVIKKKNPYKKHSIS